MNFPLLLCASLRGCQLLIHSERGGLVYSQNFLLAKDRSLGAARVVPRRCSSGLVSPCDLILVIFNNTYTHPDGGGAFKARTKSAALPVMMCWRDARVLIYSGTRVPRMHT